MRDERGFTLIELIVTLAIAAIVTTFAIPGFRHILRDNQASTQVNSLLAGFKQARSEAVTRSEAIAICPRNTAGTDCSGGNDWTNGWIVRTNPGQTDFTVLQVGQKMENGTTIKNGAPSSVQYLPSGTRSTSTASSIIRLTMGSGSDAEVRCLNISAQGQTSTKKIDSAGTC